LQCFEEGFNPQYGLDLLSRPAVKIKYQTKQPGGYQASSDGWARNMSRLAGVDLSNAKKKSNQLVVFSRRV
jgi:hypothetical protein